MMRKRQTSIRRRQNPNDEIVSRTVERRSTFVNRASFDIRHWAFGILPSSLAPTMVDESPKLISGRKS